MGQEPETERGSAGGNDEMRGKEECQAKRGQSSSPSGPASPPDPAVRNRPHPSPTF